MTGYRLAARPGAAHLADRGSSRWWEHAACAGMNPDLFEPVTARGRSGYRRAGEEAKRVCRSCPVAEQCWADAVAQHDVDIVRAGHVCNGRQAGQLATLTERCVECGTPISKGRYCMRNYCQRLRRLRHTGTTTSQPIAEHGRHNTYTYGCRCPACTAAHAAYSKQQRAKAKQARQAAAPPPPRQQPDIHCVVGGPAGRPGCQCSACTAASLNRLPPARRLP